jgi:hypothetical protein
MAKRGLKHAGGFVEIWGVDGAKEEHETFTCCHCNNPFRKPGPNDTQVGFCRQCFRDECLGCAVKLNGRCVAFERQIDQYEKMQQGKDADVRMLQAAGVLVVV